jgi:hypothetical protein
LRLTESFLEVRDVCGLFLNKVLGRSVPLAVVGRGTVLTPRRETGPCVPILVEGPSREDSIAFGAPPHVPKFDGRVLW